MINKTENYWKEFSVSGSIFDYLKYKENEEALKNDNKGLGNKGADDRGEGQVSISPYC